MIKIWKYQLRADNYQSVQMPKGSVILYLERLDGILYVWAQIETVNELEDRTFRIYGTGWEIPQGEPKVYLGSYHTDSELVYHVFEEIKYDKAI